MRNVLLTVMMVAALATLAFAQVEPRGIIIEPPEESGLSVRIWVDKPVYTLQEKVRIHFELNQAAYVYIWDIDPAGKVTKLLPNYYESSNYFRAGSYTIPSSGAGYTFGFSPGSPTGTEWLQIMAAKQPVPQLAGGFSADVPFPLLGSDPEGWQAQLKVEVQGLIPEPTDRAFAFTSFQVISGVAPGYGTLQVDSTPSLARLYVDGVLRGWTPKSLDLIQGFHDVLIRKSGYQDYTARVYIMQGRTRTLTVNLSPVAPNQPPVAQFTVMPSAPMVGTSVTFDASGSYDPDGYITNYRWDFDGDGTFDRSGRVTSWTFFAPGTYSVQLVVTDDQGATGQQTRRVAVGAPNQPPVPQFSIVPPNPTVGTTVTFDASGSYDPDGYLTAYQWDLDGDGSVDHYGQAVSQTYYAPGTYTVTLYITDDRGASQQTSRPVYVAPLGIPGMPPMGGMPGIYVWGTDQWNITVNGTSGWGSPHAYRLELRTDGTFLGVSTDSGPAPLGLVPEPTEEGWRVVFDGSVSAGRVTYTFRVSGASSIYMDLRLDIDGDGDLDRSPGFVHLRQRMVSPPTNPFVLGVPEGYEGPFSPSLDFRIGTALTYTENVRLVFYSTTIRALEG
ncbi:MAG: PKD domain-containing protein [Candidatus Bipolaricaulaceae bacterium]